MKKYDFLIVGSGLYGAVIAHELRNNGKRCLIIEKRPHKGGNIYTEKLAGIDVHRYGAHIFHTDNRTVWEYINSFGEFNNFINSPVANYKNEIYNLPFNMNTFNRMWDVVNPADAQRIIEEQRRADFCENPSNLKEQAINLVGRDIYEKLIRGYTEKQWGRPCEKLPAFIINRLPVRFTYDNNYFNSRYQGVPREGYTAIIDKLTEGIEVKLNTDFLENRESWIEKAESVIYTGAVDAFFDYRLGTLEYRKLSFKTEVLERSNFQGVAVMNYTDSEVPYTRIIEHKHFVYGMQPKTVISYEFSNEWKKGDEPYYPVNDRENSELYLRYKTLADKQAKVYFGGRLGEYKYYDMDVTVESALKLADKLKQLRR